MLLPGGLTFFTDREVAGPFKIDRTLDVVRLTLLLDVIFELDVRIDVFGKGPWSSWDLEFIEFTWRLPLTPCPSVLGTFWNSFEKESR